MRGSVFIGDTGTGKSVIMSDGLTSRIEEQSLVPFTVNFSAQTSAARTQDMLEIRFEKRRKGVLGAPINKKLVCFVDDVNMPAREEYGAQPPIELLRLCIDSLEYYRSVGGIWDKKKNWNDVVDTIFVAACGPPGGGRNVVTPRFFRFFTMINLSPPSRSVLKVIFSAILDGHLAKFPNDIRALSNVRHFGF